MKKRNGFYPPPGVDAAGSVVVSQAGGLPLTETVRAVGLDRALSAAMAPWRGRWRCTTRPADRRRAALPHRTRRAAARGDPPDGRDTVSVPSLVAAAVDQFPTPVVEPGAVPAGVLAALGRVADPRARREVRHRCTAILGIGVCAVLSGARSYVAIAEWAHDLTSTVRYGLGLGRAAPWASTIRRVFHRVDPEALDGVVSSWLAARSSPQHPGR